MDRRDVLKGVLSTASALALTSTVSVQPFVQPAHAQIKARRYIDVHCHFFNAADIPVRGFVQVVALSDYAAVKASPQHAMFNITFGVWKGLAATLAEFMLRRSAPTPREELACLQNTGACQDFALAEQRVATRSLRARPVRRELSAPQDVTSADSDEKILSEILADQDEKKRLRGYTRSLERAQPPANSDVDEFMDFIKEEMKSDRNFTQPEARTRSFDAPSSRTRSLKTASSFLLGGYSSFSRYFSWAQLLTSYRANIADNYASLYAKERSNLILAAPALVDYNYWLDDQGPAALSEQIELMAALSLRQPRPTHGFVPFDPLRQIRHKHGEPSALEIVQDAIETKGFLGVKLYSPMGFRPHGNAEEPLPFPVHADAGEEGFGAKLDDALDQLYQWCHEEDVPIMAHTSDSQAAGTGFGARANPVFWQAVLEKYPYLRINFAHFGYFTHAFIGEGDAMNKFDRSWELQIGKFAADKNFPNIFADISYFWWVLGGDSINANQIAIAKTLFGRYFESYDINVETLLFGTDYAMISRSAEFEKYLDNVQSFFLDVGLTQDQLDNIFYKNAMRFLGLEGWTKTLGRLRNFYENNGQQMLSFT